MTTKRWINFAKQWESGSLEICELFSYHTTYPQDLHALQTLKS
ncbi:DUF1643 domain-containing protein [Bacillus luti]